MQTTLHHPLLQSLIATIPLFQQVIPTDVSVALADTEKIIAYFPGKIIDLKIKAGAPLHPGTPAYDALQEGKPRTSQVPASLFGVEFTASLLPLADESGRIIGILSMGMQRQNEQELRNISNIMVESLNQATQNAHHVSNGALQLGILGSELVTQSAQANEQFKQIGQVIDLIRNVAVRANILGLNASIEASRAQESGRGFGVVADEIRKLSTNTQSSVKDIQDILSSIQESFRNIHDSIQKIASVVQTQSESTEQINRHIENIHSISKELKHYADLI